VRDLIGRTFYDALTVEFWRDIAGLWLRLGCYWLFFKVVYRLPVPDPFLRGQLIAPRLIAPAGAGRGLR
jgi:hypothetical protein